jgi:AcrR family transcriptional regulator
MTTRTPSPVLQDEGLRERNKRRRVKQILTATRELIREHPDEAPTVEAIAARAEVAPATIFNLIGPRPRIWAAIADEALAEAERRMAELSDADPYRRARHITTTTLDVLLEDPAVQRYVLSHWAESGRLLRRDPRRELLASLREAQKRKSLPRDADLRALAESISTACTGALHQWAAGLISEAALRRRCTLSVDLAFAAATTDQALRKTALRASGVQKR